MSDRLAALTAVVRVAECGSFSAAAARLNQSKSVVSRQVSALEASLGVRLFQRTTRALTLTEAGRRYVERVAPLLAELEQADQCLSALQAAPRGLVRLSAPMSFGIRHLAPALPEFLARYPELEIDLAMNDRFVDLVEEGFDLALRIGRLAPSSLVARRLAPLRRVVCASPAYLAAHGTPRTPDELSRHQCLGYTTLNPAGDWRFVTPEGRPWPVSAGGRLRANNGDTLRQAALAGLGLINQPSFIVGADLQAGSLVSLLTEFITQDGGIYAVWPGGRHLAPKVRVLIEFLAERFGPRPYWDLVE